MKLKSVGLLKAEVEKIFGRKILSSSDCQNLCNEITRTNSVKISFNTIRRFFNLMKADGQPSMYTLNALSIYCGFSSFDSFITIKEKSGITGQQEEVSILLNFLTLFFKNIEVCKRSDATYLSLVQQTVLQLDHHPSIIDCFQREIAKTKNGQSFYFEEFVFVDKLNSYYGSGLLYYLNEKNTKEAQIFGYSLLCYHSWLTQNNEGLQKHYQKVMYYDIDKSISNSVNARYFAAQLFYAAAFGLDQQAIMVKAKRFYLSAMHEPESSTSNCFETIFSEALILTANYENALFYIEELLIEVKRNIPCYIEVSLYESICVLKAIAFANTARKTKAFEILKNINPNKFSFLSRKFMNILYLSVRQMLKNKTEEQEQIQHLIHDTGFTRLSSICYDEPELIKKEVGKFGQKLISI